MNDIRRRAHEWAQEHQQKNGCSLMRAYTAGALDERFKFKSIIEKHNLRIFISGKVSGGEYYTTRRKFSDAEKHLESLGYQVINPMLLCEKHWSWLRCMAVCLWHLSKCHGICLLPDWRHSRGARIEYRLACSLKKDIFVSDDL